LYGRQIRNVRSVLGRAFLATKLQVGVTGLTLLASRNGTIQPMVGDGRTVGGGVMSNVLSLRCARERAWQPGGGSNGHAFKGLGQSVWKYKTTERDGRTASNQRLLERLEAENAQLRERLVELALQIQALRDRARTLTA
jgi:hypothetical protein